MLSPEQAYSLMCKAFPAKQDSPFFTLSNAKPITYSQYQSKLKYFIQVLV